MHVNGHLPPRPRSKGYPEKMKHATPFERAVLRSLKLLSAVKRDYYHATAIENHLRTWYQPPSGVKFWTIAIGAALQRLVKGNHITMTRDHVVKYRKYYRAR